MKPKKKIGNFGGDKPFSPKKRSRLRVILLFGRFPTEKRGERGDPGLFLCFFNPRLCTEKKKTQKIKKTLKFSGENQKVGLCAGSFPTTKRILTLKTFFRSLWGGGGGGNRNFKKFFFVTFQGAKKFFSAYKKKKNPINPHASTPRKSGLFTHLGERLSKKKKKKKLRFFFSPFWVGKRDCSKPQYLIGGEILTPHLSPTCFAPTPAPSKLVFLKKKKRVLFILSGIFICEAPHVTFWGF